MTSWPQSIGGDSALTAFDKSETHLLPQNWQDHRGAGIEASCRDAEARSIFSFLPARIPTHHSYTGRAGFYTMCLHMYSLVFGK